MSITTTHTLQFILACEGNDRHTAAIMLITLGAAGFKVDVSSLACPMPEGADLGTRRTTIRATCEDLDALLAYQKRTEEALLFIGAEVIE